MSDTLTTIGMPDFCYIENHSDDQTHTFSWRDDATNKIVTLTVKPRTKALMPRTAVNAWFGDPSLADHPTDPRRKSRTDMLERIAIRWGIFVGEPAVDAQTGQINPKFPQHLVITDFSQTPLPTIHRDPYGETLAPITAEAAQAADQQRQIAAMSAAIEQLKAQIAQNQGEEFELTSELPVGPPPNRPTTAIDVDPDSPALPDESSIPKPKPKPGQRVEPMHPITDPEDDEA